MKFLFFVCMAIPRFPLFNSNFVFSVSLSSLFSRMPVASSVNVLEVNEERRPTD